MGIEVQEQEVNGVDVTDKSVTKATDKESVIWKKILLGINVTTLIIGTILLVMGAYVNARHASFHETWHVSYGFFNASVICITVSVAIIAISVLGKIFSFTIY